MAIHPAILFAKIQQNAMIKEVSGVRFLMKEIQSLTSLRGVFAIWVLLFHLNRWSLSETMNIPIIDQGYLAVDFFFLLSGFILGAAHGREMAGRYEPYKYAMFIAKRFSRLFPLHWAVLGFSMAVAMLTGYRPSWWFYVLTEAALVHRWDLFLSSGTSINPPDWSISTEWAANLLFPGFAWLTLKGTERAFAAGGLFTVALIYAVAHNQWSLDISMSHSPLPLIRCLAEFGAGMLIYRWRDRLRPFGSNPALLTLGGGIILANLVHVDIIVIPMMVLIIGGCVYSDAPIVRLMSAPIPYFFGKISYSIYLTQIPILLLIRFLLQKLGYSSIALYWSATIVAVVATSYLTYTAIELPARRWLTARAVRYLPAREARA